VHGMKAQTQLRIWNSAILLVFVSWCAALGAATTLVVVWVLGRV